MHRYLAQGRWALGREVLRTFALAMLDRIEPVYAADIRMATELADRHPGISARDLVHAAVMQRLGIDQIISADPDFDRLPGITRLEPHGIREWGESFPTPGRFLRRPPTTASESLISFLWCPDCGRSSPWPPSPSARRLFAGRTSPAAPTCEPSQSWPHRRWRWRHGPPRLDARFVVLPEPRPFSVNSSGS